MHFDQFLDAYMHLQFKNSEKNKMKEITDIIFHCPALLFNYYILSSDFVFPFPSVLCSGQVLISNKVHTHVTTVKAIFLYACP